MNAKHCFGWGETRMRTDDGGRTEGGRKADGRTDRWRTDR